VGVRILAILGVVVLAALVLFRPAVRPPAQSGWSANAAAGTAAPDPRPPAEHRRSRRRTRGDDAAPAAAGAALAYVAGWVARPGVYPVPPGARVRDLLAAAGGARGDADLVAVNLAAHVEDGDEVVVPARGEAGPARRTRREHGPRRRAHTRGHRGRHVRAEPPAVAVDLNAADATLLATIPGIGPTLAERIIAFRAANGRFTSPDELLDVEGFTEGRLDAVAAYVTVR
jgi:competence protein ComEA